VSFALKSSCSECGRPRSAKTLPLLFSALVGLFLLVAMSILPFSVKSFGLSEALVDKVEVPLRRGDTALRFLLKRV
jgi:hypothetical protein